MNVQTTMGRACLSADPRCSALVPCYACYDRMLRRVVPRAMATSQAFYEPAEAVHFIQAFSAAWAEERAVLESELAVRDLMGVVPPAAEPPAPLEVPHEEPAPPPPMDPEHQAALMLEAFRHAFVEHVEHVDDKAKELMRKGCAEGTLEGWSEMTEAEKEVVRSVLGVREVDKREEEKKGEEKVEAKEDPRPMVEDRVEEEKKVGQVPAQNGAEEHG